MKDYEFNEVKKSQEVRGELPWAVLRAALFLFAGFRFSSQV